MGVKVHLLKRVAGPDGNFASGSTIEVSEAQAKALVAGGAAERIDKMQAFVVAAPQATEEDRAEKPKREKAVEKAASKRETADEK